MRSVIVLAAVLFLSGCASQGRNCSVCGDSPRRTSLLRRIGLGRPEPEISSVPVIDPAPRIIPGSVKPVPTAQPHGTPAKVGAVYREGMLQ